MASLTLKSYFRFGQKYKCLITCNAMISIGKDLTILQSVDSTNNYAMAGARAGLTKHGDVFFALEQLHGKGQRGKTWQTEPGLNIMISVVLNPEQLKISQQFQLSTAIALASLDFFASYAGEETSIKWPNDIYWRDRKAGGILIENSISNGLISNNDEPGEPTFKWQWAIVGIGININQTNFPESLTNPVSLKQITGKDWDVIELTGSLCACIENRYDQLLRNIDLLPIYNNCLYKRSQKMRFRQGTRVFEGIIKEVDERGQLCVVGSIEEQFSLGEIEWIL